MTNDTEGEAGDPLDLTLREVFGVVEDDPDFETPAGNPVEQREQVIEAFSELHPAAAGRLLRLLVDGLDTQNRAAQGGYHGDFQRSIRNAAREPNAHMDDPDDVFNG